MTVGLAQAQEESHHCIQTNSRKSPRSLKLLNLMDVTIPSPSAKGLAMKVEYGTKCTEKCCQCHVGHEDGNKSVGALV